MVKVSIGSIEGGGEGKPPRFPYNNKRLAEVVVARNLG
jgi:hypothetical protein